MSSSTLFSVIFLFILVSISTALEVSPGSRCASVCLNEQTGNGQDPKASTTNVTDIVCEDVNYYSTSPGTKFKNCVECLRDSTQVSGNENDIAWFLWNLRYAVDVCLFSYPSSSGKTTSSPCDINYACQPLRTALTNGITSPGNTTQWQYCSADNGAFNGHSLSACTQCLQASSDQSYLSNFLIALEAGCEQKPAPGTLLGLSGSLFSDLPLNITDAPVNQTAVATKNKSHTGMTVGAIVGIVVGAGLLFLGAIALFVVHWRRQKRFSEDTLLPKSDRSHAGSSYDGGSITAPVAVGLNSQHYTMDYKQPPPDYELQENRSFANNAAYYDAMGDDLPLRRSSKESQGSHQSNTQVGGALPIHPAYLPRALIAGRTPSRSPSRSASRNPSPEPPRPQQNSNNSNNNKRASYAIEVYLGAPDEASNTSTSRRLPPPPLAPPPSSNSNYTHQRQTQQPAYNSSAIPLTRPEPFQFAGPPGMSTKGPAPPSVSQNPIPPPPPRAPKVPSLVMPSVPRLRVPKKYSPPQIQIQDATPIDRDEQVDISGPLAFPDSHYSEHPSQGARSRPLSLRMASTDGQVVQQTLKRTGQQNYTEIAIGSGKSALYGI